MADTYVLISSVTVGSGGTSSINFTSIPGTYTDLLLKASTRSNVNGYGTDMTISINGSTSSFSSRRLYGYSNGIYNDVETNKFGLVNGGTSTSNTFSSNDIYLHNYAGSTHKTFSVDGTVENNSGSVYLVTLTGTLWSNTSPITSLSISDNTGATFQQYSIASLYGIKNS